MRVVKIHVQMLHTIKSLHFITKGNEMCELSRNQKIDIYCDFFGISREKARAQLIDMGEIDDDDNDDVFNDEYVNNDGYQFQIAYDDVVNNEIVMLQFNIVYRHDEISRNNRFEIQFDDGFVAYIYELNNIMFLQNQIASRYTIDDETLYHVSSLMIDYIDEIYFS